MVLEGKEKVLAFAKDFCKYIEGMKCFALMFLGVLFWCLNLSAQVAVVTTGTTVVNKEGGISYTIGQVCYCARYRIDYSVSEGIQQTFDGFVVGINELQNYDIKIEIYPNPVREFLILEIDKHFFRCRSMIQYYLFSINGKLLGQKQITSHLTQINMHSYISGVYVLKVKSEDQVIKTCKVIKY